MLTGTYSDQTKTVTNAFGDFEVALPDPAVHRKVKSKMATFAGMTEQDILQSGKIEIMLECFDEIVRHSVKGHKVMNDGQELPFKMTAGKVSDETMKAYYYMGITEVLGPAIINMTFMQAEERKN